MLFTIIIKILVGLTCIHYVRVPKSSIENKWLGTILGVLLLTEITTTILRANGLAIGKVYAVSMSIHNSLWLGLLLYVLKLPKSTYWIVGAFIGYSLIRLFTHDFSNAFAYDLFYSSSILYIVLFLAISFQRLRQEKIPFFQSNQFIVISAPLLFFMGFSLLFVFESNSITRVEIIGKLTLYHVIALLVNIFYYGILNYYIHKESRTSSALKTT